MAKIDFVISRTKKKEGGYTFKNYFTIDGHEVTFADISKEDKYIFVEGIKGALGFLAAITLQELGFKYDGTPKDLK